MPADVAQAGSGVEELRQIRCWAAGLDALDARIAPRFRRPEVRGRARRYLAGLLGRGERKNGWQLAEEAGGRPAAAGRLAEGLPAAWARLAAGRRERARPTLPHGGAPAGRD